MTRAFHGTGEQAIKWLVEEYREFEHEVFLRMWHQGDAEAEWPEFYEWLDRQPVMAANDRIMQLVKSDCEVRDDRWSIRIDAGDHPCGVRVIHRQHGDYYDWPEAVFGDSGGNCVAADRAYVMQDEANFRTRSSAMKAAHDFLRRFGAGEVEYLEFDVDSQNMVVVGHAERRVMAGWHNHVADTADPLAPFYAT